MSVRRIYTFFQIFWCAGLAIYWWVHVPRATAAAERQRDEEAALNDKSACLARLAKYGQGGARRSYRDDQLRQVLPPTPEFNTLTVPKDAIETEPLCESRWNNQNKEIDSKPYLSNAYREQYGRKREAGDWLLALAVLAMPLVLFLGAKSWLTR